MSGRTAIFGLVVAGIGIAAAAIAADTGAGGPVLSLTATTENVTGAPDAVRIEVLRWSTDAERDHLVAAWNLTATPSAGGRGAGGRGARAGGPVTGEDPALEGVNPTAPARAGRGGRGGRGGGAPAPPLTPERSLEAALGTAATVGYLWSSEVAGYALRSAVRLPEANGGERILLMTERRLGAWNDLWKLSGAAAGNGAAPDYEFSVIELHLNSKAEGEGKASLTGKIAVDSAKTLALENYDALPVVLKNVKRRAAGK